jgi:adenine/guanine phosphoribosyltransferase-like PRPP-binding protein
MRGVHAYGAGYDEAEAIMGETFTEPTTQYWQHVCDHVPAEETRPPFRLGYPVRLPDGRWLRLPIRTRQQDPDRAVASFIANHASFAVLDALAGHMADQVASLEPDVVVGLPTLGLPLATPLARRLGHDRIVPFGTSRKYWYDDRWSHDTCSITTTTPRRLYVDPNLVPLLAGRRVLVVDDTISTGTTALAALGVLHKIGARPAGIALAMSQGDAWRSRLNPDQCALVSFVFQTPHLVRDPRAGGWVTI